MLGLSRGEIILVAMIVGLVFGWSGLPKLGARLGALFDGRPNDRG
jgi:Sec-independent protein translocase protein TatA